MTSLTMEHLVDFEPQFPGYEHVGPEPSLWKIVFNYYRAHFDEKRSEELTETYFETLSSGLVSLAIANGTAILT